MTTIIVDAMGGDFAPEAPVAGGLMALKKDPNLRVVFTGYEDVIKAQLEGKKYPADRVIIHPTTQVIESEEHNPADAVREKRDSSMVVGCAMIKNKEADGFVSAGNTGALLSAATLFSGRIKGVKRAVMPGELPAGDTPTLLLDVGANMDAKPEWILQFARMATIYMRKCYNLEKPSVGLLNVGTEPGKGNELSKLYYEALSQDTAINFAGNVEAREALDGRVDIIVTDAFAGNVLLKSIEGTALYVGHFLKKGIYGSLRGKLGGLLLKPMLDAFKKKLDPSAVGGTPLLGTNGAVLKAHGNSKAIAFCNAVLRARDFAGSGINEEIERSLKEMPAVTTVAEPAAKE